MVVCPASICQKIGGPFFADVLIGWIVPLVRIKIHFRSEREKNSGKKGGNIYFNSFYDRFIRRFLFDFYCILFFAVNSRYCALRWFFFFLAQRCRFSCFVKRREPVCFLFCVLLRK